MADVMEKLELSGKKSQVLLIIPNGGNDFAGVVKGARNIKGVIVRPANQINTYEILTSKRILFMKDAITSLKETFLK
jgi:ribosomal protein L4